MGRIVLALKTAGILAACLMSAAFALMLAASPVFQGGQNYELYLGASSSSRQLVTDNPLRDKLLLPVVGESARYDGDRAEEIISAFKGTLQFTEEADGVVNYYLYSQMLGEPVLLNGYAVNLHVAVRSERTAVGTPLIFGGF